MRSEPREANLWGLYDMQGNVRQWCEDYYGPCKVLDAKDPLRLDKGYCDRHVLRGSSALFTAEICRAACRGWDAAGYRKQSGVGFRVCFRLD